MAMRLRNCILLSLLLTTASILWLSCDKGDTVYCSSPGLNIRFVPITTYGRLYTTPDDCLVSYAPRDGSADNGYQLVKIHSNGMVDSIDYDFTLTDNAKVSGDIYVGQNGEVYLYTSDYRGTKAMQVLKFDNDLTHYTTINIVTNPTYALEERMPIMLSNGNFAYIASPTSDDYYTRNQWLYRTDAEGSLQDSLQLAFSDSFYADMGILYHYDNTYIVTFTDWSEELMKTINSLAFFDNNGTHKCNVVVSSNFTVLTLQYVGGYLYVSEQATIGNYEDGSSRSAYFVHKLGLDGIKYATTQPLCIAELYNITEIGGRIIVAGYDAQRGMSGDPESYVGKIYSIDKESLTDIDTIKLSYNVQPFAVFQDEKDGCYDVFLSHRFNYDEKQKNNQNVSNVYIYHVDDLHNLQLEQQ